MLFFNALGRIRSEMHFRPARQGESQQRSHEGWRVRAVRL